MSEVTGVFECFLSQVKEGECGEQCDYSEHFLGQGNLGK